jgi:hypothetical protein
MELKDFWTIYVGEESPADFMQRHGTQSPEEGVARFMEQHPDVLGIMRRNSWKETFQAPVQFTCESVSRALITYLEETREQWAQPQDAMPASPAPPPEAPVVQSTPEPPQPDAASAIINNLN